MIKDLTISIKMHLAWRARTLEPTIYTTHYIKLDTACTEWWTYRYKPIEEKKWKEHLISSI